jgi:hypothetical protein
MGFVAFSMTTLCHYAECHYAKCHYAERHLLSVVLLSVVMLNVVAPLSSPVNYNNVAVANDDNIKPRCKSCPA